MTSSAAVPTIIIPSMNPVLRELAASFIPPGWPVIVKDGNPHKHFAELKTLDIGTRWAINVDEDCFLIDPAGILRLIATMEAQGYDMAAVQDGASNLRHHNPVIFNPYFFIFDVAKLQATPTVPGLDPATESLKFSHLVRFKELPYAYDGFEPYYPFFIDLLNAGMRPLYLNNHALSTFQPREYDMGKPSIVYGEDGAELAIHSWYSRLWHMPVVQERIRTCAEYAMANPNCLRHADLPPVPQADPGAFNLGIATVQHNRGPFLKHWFAFHHAVGFRKFHFYADRCTDETGQVLASLAGKLDISVYALNEGIAQPKLTAFQHACNTALAGVDWLAFLDGDQYLFPVDAPNVQQALEPYARQGVSALALYLAPVSGLSPAVVPDGAAHANYGHASMLRGGQQAQVTESGQLFATPHGTVDELLRPVAAGQPSPTSSFEHLQVSVYPLGGGYQPASGNARRVAWLDAKVREVLAWLDA